MNGWILRRLYLYGVLGKRFGSGGLQDLIVESGVIGPTASKLVISGEHYSCTLRVHKLVFKSPLQLTCAAFEVAFAFNQEVESQIVSQSLQLLWLAFGTAAF